ncbi:MAG: phosphomannomutase/phosphoglucomutase [Candidatus Daviesbacteria bacterium]
MPQLKKTMFREYDIRGLESDDELNENSMYYLGKGFGTFLAKRGIKKTIVGHDIRSSSESFHHQTIKGLLETGIDVIDIGIATTPKGYWAQHFLNIKGLAIITASHNPVGWNGAKIGSDLSRTLHSHEIQEVYEIILKENFLKGKGKLTKKNILEEYIKDLISKVNIKKKFKILVNTGNGTAAIVAPKILSLVGCEVVEHNTQIDPTYPNYTPNPEEKAMMKDTSLQTVKNQCFLGFAFDGDGDRVGLVDEKGNVIWPDRYMILLSRLVLSEKPNSKIIFDVKVSESLPEDIKAHGGIPIMSKTGHSLIKSKIKEEGAALAGEMSGHIYFAQGYYGFDDAIFASLKILEYLSTQDKKLSEIINATPYYISTPTISVKTSDEKKHKIVKKLVEEFKKEGYQVIDIDGARVYVDDSWGLVRASNTTPTLVLRFESKTKKGLDKIQKLFRKKLKKYIKSSFPHY